LLGVAYIHLKEFKLAEQLLNKSLAFNPSNHSTLLNLASLYKEQNKFELAITFIEKVLAKDPNNLAALFNLGNIHRLMENWEAADSHYEKVLQLNSNHLPAIITLGLMKKNAGEIKQAIALFHRALNIDPFNKTVYLALANLKKYQFSDNEISLITTIINQSPDEECIELLFAKAQFLEHAEKYTEAFSYLERANQAHYKKINRTPYDWDAYNQKIISVFEGVEFQQSTSSLQDTQPQPLFIVSMPRSGSTLVEQILASHSAVFGASELQTFTQLVKHIEADKKLLFPEVWQQVETSDLKAMAETYQQKINSFGKHFKYVSDKSLINFNYVGAILSSMPNSLFIHCSRHPMDVCLSCYKQLFAAGQEYSYNIEELVSYYKHHEKIMNYWKKKFPNQILTINYEDLIEDTESQIARMLNFLGLKWEENCMAFHKTKRVIRTASAAQVTKEIYKDASHRYKKYGDLLDFLKKNLNNA
jgi:tetratricopeptide (TPR) repeat protein